MGNQQIEVKKESGKYAREMDSEGCRANALHENN
jgi:hypothetical protein